MNKVAFHAPRTPHRIAMKTLGWLVVALGLALLARDICLGALHFGQMSESSRDRFLILLGVAPCIAAVGAWIILSPQVTLHTNERTT